MFGHTMIAKGSPPPLITGLIKPLWFGLPRGNKISETSKRIFGPHELGNKEPKLIKAGKISRIRAKFDTFPIMYIHVFFGGWRLPTRSRV